jgi:hypothetical protein
VPGLYTRLYGPVPITGIELDPAILAVGRQFSGRAGPTIGRSPATAVARLASSARRHPLRRDRRRRLSPPTFPSTSPQSNFLPWPGSTWPPTVSSSSTSAAPTPTQPWSTPSPPPSNRSFPPSLWSTNPGRRRPWPIRSWSPPGCRPRCPPPRPGRQPCPPHNPPNGERLPAARWPRPARPPPLSDTPIFTDDRSQVEEVVHRLIFNFLVGPPPPETDRILPVTTRSLERSPRV